MFRIKFLGLDIYGCREALERLDDYVDRELSPTETRKVRQHLKICHECARKFAFEEGFVVGMRAKVDELAVPADLEGLKSRLSQALQHERETDSPDKSSNS